MIIAALLLRPTQQHPCLVQLRSPSPWEAWWSRLLGLLLLLPALLFTRLPTLLLAFLLLFQALVFLLFFPFSKLQSPFSRFQPLVPPISSGNAAPFSSSQLPPMLSVMLFLQLLILLLPILALLTVPLLIFHLACSLGMWIYCLIHLTILIIDSYHSRTLLLHQSPPSLRCPILERQRCVMIGPGCPHSRASWCVKWRYLFCQRAQTSFHYHFCRENYYRR